MPPHEVIDQHGNVLAPVCQLRHGDPVSGQQSQEWVEAPVEPCRSGIHACRPGDLPMWVADELYEIELAGEIVHERTKVVAPRARLLRRVDAYTRWAFNPQPELTSRYDRG